MTLFASFKSNAMSMAIAVGVTLLLMWPLLVLGMADQAVVQATPPWLVMCLCALLMLSMAYEVVFEGQSPLTTIRNTVFSIAVTLIVTAGMAGFMPAMKLLVKGILVVGGYL